MKRFFIIGLLLMFSSAIVMAETDSRTVNCTGEYNFDNGFIWKLKGTKVTSSAAELNILTGCSSTAAKLNAAGDGTTPVLTPTTVVVSGTTTTLQMRVKDTLTVVTNANVNGSLTVSGNAAVTGAVTITGSAALNGGASLSENGVASTIDSGVSNATTQFSMNIKPAAASRAVCGAADHTDILRIGDGTAGTGSTIWGFSDPAHKAYGIAAYFGRGNNATGTWWAVDRPDVGMYLQTHNQMTNVATYCMEAMHVRAYNYTGGVASNVVGLKVETDASGTQGGTVSAIQTDGDASTDYLVDMQPSASPRRGDIRLSDAACVISGSAANRAALILVGSAASNAPAGSVYISTTGKVYIRTALSTPSVTQDWATVTSGNVE